MDAQPITAVSSKLTTDAQNRLSHMMNDLREGKTTVLRTPFLKALTPEEIMDSFDKAMMSKLKSLTPTLGKIELEQKAKFGPRSIQKPWSERKDGLLKSFEIPKFKDDNFSEQIADLHSNFAGNRRLRPMQSDEVLRYMKRTSNAGLPTLVSKGKILDGEIDYRPLDDNETWPCMTFTRTQEMGKTRDVLAMAMNLLAREGQIFLPFFNLFRQSKFVSALGGPDEVDTAITRLMFSIKGDEHVISEDFSAFDQTVGEQLHKVAFHVIGTYFQDGSDIREKLKVTEDNFTNIGYITPDGIISGSHGIPSGSWFTNVVGSLVHAFAQSCVRKLDPTKCQVMGDDGVLVVPKTISKEAVADLYSEIGLTFNADKTFESEDEIIYLQRYYSKEYMHGGIVRGIYPIYRALIRLVFMERWTNIEKMEGKDYFSLRAISILENCKWHPLHEELVRWTFSKDKYNLQYSSDSLTQFIRKFSNKIATDVKNQYSDYVEGIASFKTMQILKRL